ncbi:MAG TPA: UDP-glucose 4-epimerase GalE [Vicinamibacterales bacterium]|nr:UDP-glucose 4-epimerase GalE [Vicinamibacterales bacterium]
MSTVLVTGGAGYIGSHAVRALVRGGQNVVVYDSLQAGHRGAVEANAALASGRVTLVEGDIRDTARLTQALRDSGADAVMHFAALLSVGDSVRDPAGYYDNNVRGALSVLAAMQAAGVGRFIFSSTAAVFGDPLETPIREDHPTRPINAYGETKLAIERALPHFERAYGLRWVALRYFNAAGADPGGALGEDHAPEIHVIPRAIDAALGRDTFAIYGDDYDTPDGTCLRDYIHVSDLASAHVLALEALRAGRPSTTYNLGNGCPISVRDIVEAVARVTGRTVPVAMAGRRPGDPGVLFASSETIRRELGWRPAHERIDAIVETAARWREAHPAGYGRPPQG